MMNFINVIYLAIRTLVGKEMKLEAYHVDGPKIEIE